MGIVLGPRTLATHLICQLLSTVSTRKSKMFSRLSVLPRPLGGGTAVVQPLSEATGAAHPQLRLADSSCR